MHVPGPRPRSSETVMIGQCLHTGYRYQPGRGETPEFNIITGIKRLRSHRSRNQYTIKSRDWKYFFVFRRHDLIRNDQTLSHPVLIILTSQLPSCESVKFQEQIARTSLEKLLNQIVSHSNRGFVTIIYKRLYTLSGGCSIPVQQNAVLHRTRIVMWSRSMGSN